VAAKTKLKASAKSAKGGKGKKQDGQSGKRKRSEGVAEAAAGEAAPEAAAPGPARPKQNKKQARAQANLEKAHRELYQPSDQVILLGERNFSFSRALCRALGSGAGVYAAAAESEERLLDKHPESAERRKEIEEQFEGTTLVGVDPTRLHMVREFRRAFHKIVWHFPRLRSTEADPDKVLVDQRQALAKFFASAARCLDPSPGSAIHVALKVGEPHKSWKVVQTAHAACPDLRLQAAVQFVPSAWPGYAAVGEEAAREAKVYVFARQR